jgi:membrane-associated PAP2 superfamily phosphatase
MKIDVSLQDYFYHFQTQQWLIDKDNQILRLIFYDGIKKVFILFVLSVLIALLFFRHTKTVQEYKQGLLIVLLSCLIVPLVVSGLKATTNIPCPKNISHYHGNYPYVTIFSSYPKDFQQQGKIKCFPAGHASGGFALLSLFFLFKRKRNKIIALISVMILSWSIGTYKMLIGDHFLSHTLVTMLLAWLLILLIQSGVNISARLNFRNK